MYFTNTIMAAFLALTSFSAAAPLELRQDDLQPWQLTGLVFGSPSGRPGSYPWSTLTANLTDPNTIVLGTHDDGTEVSVPAGNQALNCRAKWFISDRPFNVKWSCDASGDGYWYMEIIESNNFGFSRYDIKWTRVAEVLYRGSGFRAKFEGSGSFVLNDNLSGSCGGSGVCSSGLKQELKPYAIQQSKVA